MSIVKRHCLSFAELLDLGDDIYEVVVDEGVDVSPQMREELKVFIQNREGCPSLLVNKLRRYSYSFQAQMNMETDPYLKAIAVVDYNISQRASTEMIKSIRSEKSVEIRQFFERTPALNWLRKQAQKVCAEA